MSYFKAKVHQIQFRLALCPIPRWGAYSAPPDPLSWIQGGLLLREVRGGRTGGKGKEGEGTYF